MTPILSEAIRASRGAESPERKVSHGRQGAERQEQEPEAEGRERSEEAEGEAGGPGQGGRLSDSPREDVGPSGSTIVRARHPRLAAGLSALLPGLGQLYNREGAKAAAILCSAGGLWAGLLWTTLGPETSRSWLTAVALLVAYPSVLVPAIQDAHRRASGAPEAASFRTGRWHLVILLLVIGPLAIPQLWQSRGFSRGAKILCTLSVALVSVIVLLLLIAIGPGLEQWIEKSSARGPFG